MLTVISKQVRCADVCIMYTITCLEYLYLIRTADVLFFCEQTYKLRQELSKHTVRRV